MRKLPLLLLLSLFCLSSSAQSYGSHIDLYQDALLVNGDDAKPDYFITGMFAIKKIDAKYSNSTDIYFKKFTGDTLKVIAIKKNPYAERPNMDYLILQSKKNGAMYAYEYFYLSFPFKVAKQVAPINQDVFCPDVQEKSDRFSDFKMITSPILEPVVFRKATEHGPFLYYVTCRTGYSTADGLGKRGVTFQFTDGTRKEFPNAAVDVSVSENKYTAFWYTCSIELNESDVKLFSEKKIQAYRLYCAERDIPEFDGIKYQAYLKCLSSK